MTSMTSPGFKSVGFRDIGTPSSFGLVPGAIAYYRFDETKNLLKYSQDFGNAIWEKTNLNITPNVELAPNGTMTADKITDLSSGTAVNHFCTQMYNGVNSTQTVTASLYAKPGTVDSIALRINPGDGNYYGITVNLSTGTIVSTTGAVTYTPPQLINGFYRISVSLQIIGTYAKLGIYPVIGGSTAFVENGTHYFYAWGAQLEVGSTPSEYFPTTDKQLLIDYSGNGNHGTLGSTSGVDTNDPQWNNYGLVYGADDYVKFGPIRNAAGVTQNLGSMSMAFYVPGAISAASTKSCSYSIGAGKAIYFGAVSGAPANNIITVQYAAGSYTSWCSATDTIPIGWHTLAVNWNGSSYEIYIDGIPKPVTTTGSPALLSLTDANCCYDGTVFGTSGLIRAGRRIYPVGLSYSDLIRDRLIMASDAAQKGIVLP